jgi:hypothetical protein
MNPLEKFAMIKNMPLGELLTMIGKKTGKFAADTGKMVAANPGKSAAIGGLGYALGSHESQEDPDIEMQEEMMRAYGIR